MRIAVIGPTYPYKGGISHFTTLLVQNLRKENKVEFISWKRQYPSFLYPVELKDTQSKNPLQTEANFILDFFNPITWLQAAFQINKSKINLLILTWVSPIQAPIYSLVTLFVKKFSKTKVIFICHNVLPHEKSTFDTVLAKLAFNKSDGFIVHGKEDKLKLAKLVSNKKIILGFHPVYDFFNTGEKINISEVKKELDLGDKVILFFGYIRPYKGLMFLLKALPEIVKVIPEIKLLIVGEFWSKDKEEYLDLIKRMKIEQYVVMINRYIPNEDVAKYFSVADVVVLPYVSATQSGITQIAYAFNKPVISTKVGGLKDVIDEGKTGYSIKTENIEDIVEKVSLFYKRPISSKDIEHRKQKWSWDKYVELIQK